MPPRRVLQTAVNAVRAPSRAPQKIPKGGGPGEPPTELEIITGDIKQLHATAAKKSVKACAEIGRLLILARNMVAHGAWGTYLQREVPYTQRTAERAMDLYRFSLQHPELFEKVATLGVSNAYFIVAFPPAIIDKVVSSTHVVPTSGFVKAPSDMSDSELFEVVLALTGSDPESNAARTLMNTYRRQMQGLIKTLKIFIATRPPIDADELAALYDDLLDTVARFAEAFALDAE